MERNRALLQRRRKQRREREEQDPSVAKMDAAALHSPVLSGRYRLEPLERLLKQRLFCIFKIFFLLRQLIFLK